MDVAQEPKDQDDSLEEKVYSSWAMKPRGGEKGKINREIYNKIKDKAQVECVGTGYAHKKYKVVENPENLSIAELALICDRGNLCFGYRQQGGLIIIHTD